MAYSVVVYITLARRNGNGIRDNYVEHQKAVYPVINQDIFLTALHIFIKRME